MASLGYFLLLARSSSAATRPRHRSSARGARSRALIESGIGAFYLVAALMTVASAVIDLRVRHGRLLDQVRRALLRQRAAAVLQDHLVLGRARRLDHVLGVPAVALRIDGGLREPRAPPRADPVRRRDHLRGADVLPLPDDRAQEPVHDLPHRTRRPTARGSTRCCRTSTWRSTRRRCTRASSG